MKQILVYSLIALMVWGYLSENTNIILMGGFYLLATILMDSK
jgi:hypothetical protein